ncbi:MAG: response regulator [Thermodesulfobacteriota bacterium]|nr:response regulator [Thermodesulfobacteriota bacterium]
MEEKILLVDDEQIIREVIGEIFKDNGYQVITASSGPQAIEILSSKEDIGVVVCDIKMPKMSGEEVLAKIRFLYPLIPVVMLTGFVDLETALEVMRRGAFDYLTKPVDEERLIHIIKKAFVQRNKIKEEFESRLKEESMAIIGRLTSGIVHNLNNPLAVIMSNTELLKIKYPGEKFLERIYIQIFKIQDIIDNLMYKTRQEQGKQERKPININKLLTEELKFLEMDQNFKQNIEKVYNLHPSLPEINSCYNDLSQSFMNIIKNALDAMSRSEVKRLSITTNFDNRYILVSFKDTGCGIEKEDIPRLFDPFFTTKVVKGEEKEGEATGTGLGLYSCQQILKPYGVKFDVKSEPGKGTDFSLYFPINPPPI